MANLYRAFGRTVELSGTNALEGTGLYILGDASDGIVGTFSIHLANLNAFTGTVTVKARSRMPQADTDAVVFQPIPYLSLYLNGAIGDMTYHTAPITGESIILVPATGLQIGLDCTVTSGLGRIYWCPMEGAAA